MDGIGASPLENQLANLLGHRKKHSRLRTLKTTPPGAVDFSSNDFLSLSTSSHVRALFERELKTHTQLGSTGSRLLDGNSSYAEALEAEIATFHNGPSGLLVNSGLDANVGIFTCLPQPGDVVIYDELIHASVHDGMRASRALRKISFAHNSVADLETILQDFLKRPEDTMANVFIAVESVYSMDGDLAPLTEIVDLIERTFPQRNGYLIVDEAHATGLYGDQGKGIVCQLGLEERVFLRLHTFGKALASSGAIIICSPITRQYLINYARPLIYTTFMSFPSLAMIKAMYTFMALGHTEPLASNLISLTESLYSNLKTLSNQSGSVEDQHRLFEIPTSCPRSPIIPLLTRQPRELAQYCQAAGYVVRPIVAPTVPADLERVRVCLHAGNTLSQIQGFILVLQSWLHRESSKQGQPTMPRARL